MNSKEARSYSGAEIPPNKEVLLQEAKSRSREKAAAYNEALGANEKPAGPDPAFEALLGEEDYIQRSQDPELKAQRLRAWRLREDPAIQVALRVIREDPEIWPDVQAVLQRREEMLDGAAEPGERHHNLMPLLAGIGLNPRARKILDEAIDRSVAAESEYYLEELKDEERYVPEIVIGSGPHGAIFNATRIQSGVEGLTVDQAERMGGQFATAKDAVFRLNSRTRPDQADMPAIPGTPGNINPFEDAPLALPGVTREAYATQADMAFTTRVNHALVSQLMMGAELISARRNGNLDTQGEMRLTFRDTKTGQEFTVRTDSVIVTSGIGDELTGFEQADETTQELIASESERFENAGDSEILTDAQYVRRKGDPEKRFPLKGYKKVIVIGDGDYGKVIGEDLLGYSGIQDDSSTQLDYLEELVWVGQKAETKEELEQQERQRYRNLGLEFPRESDENYASRIVADDGKATDITRLPDGTIRVFVTDEDGNQTTYEGDHVILCTGKKDDTAEIFAEANMVETRYAAETIKGSSKIDTFADSLDSPSAPKRFRISGKSADTYEEFVATEYGYLNTTYSTASGNPEEYEAVFAPSQAVSYLKFIAANSADDPNLEIFVPERREITEPTTVVEREELVEEVITDYEEIRARADEIAELDTFSIDFGGKNAESVTYKKLEGDNYGIFYQGKPSGSIRRENLASILRENVAVNRVVIPQQVPPEKAEDLVLPGVFIDRDEIVARQDEILAQEKFEVSLIFGEKQKVTKLEDGSYRFVTPDQSIPTTVYNRKTTVSILTDDPNITGVYIPERTVPAPPPQEVSQTREPEVRVIPEEIITDKDEIRTRADEILGLDRFSTTYSSGDVYRFVKQPDGNYKVLIMGSGISSDEFNDSASAIAKMLNGPNLFESITLPERRETVGVSELEPSESLRTFEVTRHALTITNPEEIDLRFEQILTAERVVFNYPDGGKLIVTPVAGRKDEYEIFNGLSLNEASRKPFSLDEFVNRLRSDTWESVVLPQRTERIEATQPPPSGIERFVPSETITGPSEISNRAYEVFRTPGASWRRAPYTRIVNGFDEDSKQVSLTQYGPAASIERFTISLEVAVKSIVVASSVKLPARIETIAAPTLASSETQEVVIPSKTFSSQEAIKTNIGEILAQPVVASRFGDTEYTFTKIPGRVDYTFLNRDGNDEEITKDRLVKYFGDVDSVFIPERREITTVPSTRETITDEDEIKVRFKELFNTPGTVFRLTDDKESETILSYEIAEILSNERVRVNITATTKGSGGYTDTRIYRPLDFYEQTGLTGRDYESIEVTKPAVEPKSTSIVEEVIVDKEAIKDRYAELFGSLGTTIRIGPLSDGGNVVYEIVELEDDGRAKVRVTNSYVEYDGIPETAISLRTISASELYEIIGIERTTAVEVRTPAREIVVPARAALPTQEPARATPPPSVQQPQPSPERTIEKRERRSVASLREAIDLEVNENVLVSGAIITYANGSQRKIVDRQTNRYGFIEYTYATKTPSQREFGAPEPTPMTMVDILTSNRKDGSNTFRSLEYDKVEVVTLLPVREPELVLRGQEDLTYFEQVTRPNDIAAAMGEVLSSPGSKIYYRKGFGARSMEIKDIITESDGTQEIVVTITESDGSIFEGAYTRRQLEQNFYRNVRQVDIKRSLPTELVGDEVDPDPIARKIPGVPVYFAGPAGRLKVTENERRQSSAYTNIPDNAVALFRYGDNTSRLATALNTVATPQPEDTITRRKPKRQIIELPPIEQAKRQDADVEKSTFVFVEESSTKPVSTDAVRLAAGSILRDYRFEESAPALQFEAVFTRYPNGTQGVEVFDNVDSQANGAYDIVIDKLIRDAVISRALAQRSIGSLSDRPTQETVEGTKRAILTIPIAGRRVDVANITLESRAKS